MVQTYRHSCIYGYVISKDAKVAEIGGSGCKFAQVDAGGSMNPRRAYTKRCKIGSATFLRIFPAGGRSRLISQFSLVTASHPSQSSGRASPKGGPASLPVFFLGHGLVIVSVHTNPAGRHHRIALPHGRCRHPLFSVG